MIQNYIKTALRNIIKHRALSTINILGLTIGLTAVVLIGIYVRYEFSFDRFHKNAEQIYRIERKGTMDGESFHLPHTNNNIPRALAEEYPSIADFVRIWPANGIIRDHRNNFHQERIYLADNSILEVFTFPLKKGNKHTALESPYSVVMTEAMARKYFQDTDVVGETLEAQVLDSSITLTVTGIMQEMPDNSHLQSEMLVSYETAKSVAPAQYLDTWVGNYLYSYVSVKPGTDIRQLESQFPEFVDKHMDNEFRQILGDDANVSEMLRLHLQGYQKEIRMKRMFTVFSILAIFIAAMGLFGLAAFMTERKTREIGIRKAIGASITRIIAMLSFQFLKWVLLANLIAWPLVYFVLKSWLQNFAYHVDLHVGYFLLSTGIAIFVAQATVFYQAFTAARTNPVESLRYE